MASAIPKPKFVVDESGNTREVILSVKDYKRLVAAWEEVADSEDFAAARRTCRETISIEELRHRVLGQK